MNRNGIVVSFGGDTPAAGELDELRDHYIMTADHSPLRPGAFDCTDEEKIKSISRKFAEILDILGLDLSDDSLQETPGRVARMYVKEIFSGLNPENKPIMTLFENRYRYHQMLVEKNITLYSTCEHHFVPIIGKAHIGYISSGKVIGLSKINRLVQYFSQRPQVQERLTVQIANELKSVLNTEDVAVVIDAAHLCLTSRGVKDVNSSTVTVQFSGKFNSRDTRNEFLSFIK